MAGLSRFRPPQTTEEENVMHAIFWAYRLQSALFYALFQQSATVEPEE